MPRKHRTDFNDLLVDSVDEAISGVLGNRVTAAFWYHYQAFLGITRAEMPYRLDTLFASLKGTFGVGGETLGRVIVKKLYAKANVPLDLKVNRSFTEHVEELKRILAEDLMQPQSCDENNSQRSENSTRNVLALRSLSGYLWGHSSVAVTEQ